MRVGCWDVWKGLLQRKAVYHNTTVSTLLLAPTMPCILLLSWNTAFSTVMVQKSSSLESKTCKNIPLHLNWDNVIIAQPSTSEGWEDDLKKCVWSQFSQRLCPLSFTFMVQSIVAQHSTSQNVNLNVSMSAILCFRQVHKQELR